MQLLLFYSDRTAIVKYDDGSYKREYIRLMVIMV